MNHLIQGVLSLFLLQSAALAEKHAPRADHHAPIGVMGDHMHKAGDLMLSYRYMYMDMDGNRDGSDRVSDAAVLADFRVTPTDMQMKMHMFGAMFAPGDRLSLMAMLPVIDKSMDHLTRMGGRFTTEADGLGDLKLTGLVRLLKREGHQLHANAGLSFPTGDIDAEDRTPMGRMRLPYPMQLGSGTWDLLPALTYAGHLDPLAWGGQLGGTIRLGENDNDYTLGDAFNASLWTQYAPAKWLSGALRLAYRNWGDIDGADPRLNPAMVPTADPDLRGGERLDLGIGANILWTSGPLQGHRVGLEVLLPLYQDLDGPQLETDLSIVAGWKKSF